jgi:hypothetical protein
MLDFSQNKDSELPRTGAPVRGDTPQFAAGREQGEQPRLAAAGREGTRLAANIDANNAVTTKEALLLFQEAGFTRTIRGIQKMCNRGTLICGLVDTDFGNKFVIDRTSISLRIQELRQFQGTPATEEDEDRGANSGELSAGASNVRDQAPQFAAGREQGEQPRPGAAGREAESVISSDRPALESAAPQPDTNVAEIVRTLEETKKENARIKTENLDLRIESRGKDKTIQLLVEEQREYAKERREMLGERKNFLLQIGELTTRLIQLAPGRPSPASPEPPYVVEARVVTTNPERPASDESVQSHANIHTIGDNSSSPSAPSAVQ